MNVKKAIPFLSVVLIGIFGLVMFFGTSGTMEAKGRRGNDARSNNASAQGQEASENGSANRNENADEAGNNELELISCTSETADDSVEDEALEEGELGDAVVCELPSNNASERGQEARERRGDNRNENANQEDEADVEDEADAEDETDAEDEADSVEDGERGQSEENISEQGRENRSQSRDRRRGNSDNN